MSNQASRCHLKSNVTLDFIIAAEAAEAVVHYLFHFWACNSQNIIFEEFVPT
jgi:hypothetical protein